MELDDAISRFSAVGRKEMLKWLTPQSCIHSTAVTLRVFEELGFPARELPVAMVVENSELELSYVSGLGPEDKKMARSTCRNWRDSIPTNGEGWEGHLIALVGGVWWLDSSFDQTQVVWGLDGIPTKGTEILALKFRKEQLETEEEVKLDAGVIIDETGARLKVQYISRPDNVGYLTSEAWRDLAIPMIARRIVREMKGIPVPEEVGIVVIGRGNSKWKYVARRIRFDRKAGGIASEKESAGRLKDQGELREFREELAKKGMVRLEDVWIASLGVPGVLEVWV